MVKGYGSARNQNWNSRGTSTLERVEHPPASSLEMFADPSADYACPWRGAVLHKGATGRLCEGYGIDVQINVMRSFKVLANSSHRLSKIPLHNY